MATVSVGAKTLANNNASTGETELTVPRVQTRIPQAIKSIDNRVTNQERRILESQVFFNEPNLNFKAEWNKIGGNPKYKNISVAKETDLPPTADTAIPNITANTDGGSQFRLFILGNPITKEIKSNNRTNSFPIRSCFIVYMCTKPKYDVP